MNGSKSVSCLIVVASLALVPLRAGTEVLLYPLARAFGSPSESELEKCREGFRRFQADIGTRPLSVLPVLSRPDSPAAGQPSAWSSAMAAALADAIHRAAPPGMDPVLKLEPVAPAVPATNFGRNQLRYLWARGAAYSRHVRSARPAGDYFLFTEIFSSREHVDGIQVYVINEAGQIVYCRLFNSHQFGNRLTLDGACGLIARQFFADLGKQPEEVFPPYGVG